MYCRQIFALSSVANELIDTEAGSSGVMRRITPQSDNDWPEPESTTWLSPSSSRVRASNCNMAVHDVPSRKDAVDLPVICRVTVCSRR